MQLGDQIARLNVFWQGPPPQAVLDPVVATWFQMTKKAHGFEFAHSNGGEVFRKATLICPAEPEAGDGSNGFQRVAITL